MYQTPITLADAVGRISRRELLLPDIQRELVWEPRQIESLWDSLLRGYPIGSFLFWRIPQESSTSVRLYDFITDFDTRNRHNLEVQLPGGSTPTVVLDGQQRLSAIRIGLCGTYREKVPRLHRTNPEAFPIKRLYLRLDEPTIDPDDELFDDGGYEVRFLTDARLNELAAANEIWFLIKDALGWDPAGIDYIQWLQQRGIANEPYALANLHKLVTVINQTPVVSHYEETTASVDRALQIFIRVNSGGTELSYSDLLFSLAIVQWSSDARRDINELQDGLNSVGNGYSFGRDRILKAALVLSNFDNIKFKAENFQSRNVTEIEANWSALSGALRLAVRLIDRLGFDESSFRAQNALIPIAYYLMSRHFDEGYLVADRYAEDRGTIRRWLAASFLRSGYWTGAVDPILLETRAAIVDTNGAYPFTEIEERVVHRTGKSLVFSPEDVDELLDERYGSWKARILLHLIFGSLTSTSSGSVDHLHPQSLFTSAAFKARGSSIEAQEYERSRFQSLPNLQLSYLLPNQEKSNKKLDEWLASFPRDERDARVRDFLLDGLPTSIDGFQEMFEGRRSRMYERLAGALGVEPNAEV